MLTMAPGYPVMIVILKQTAGYGVLYEHRRFHALVKGGHARSVHDDKPGHCLASLFRAGLKKRASFPLF